ncbi:hypothetical protein [Saccharopolyspora gloriosae]|uniref:hypothetical protein n=1 Tax=Saccharopolyspora gloriosae TaxID=455344 RepID=UPI001FB76535|nr:hypothetical protein [Saccharopolyspora gloriosae]
MKTRTPGLPCAWHYHAERNLTLRWARPDGHFTIHAGDQRGKHSNHTLLDTVRVSPPWQDDHDVARKAHDWATKNPHTAGGVP